MILLLLHPHGQTANLLQLHAHFRAACLDHGWRLITPRLTEVGDGFAFSRPSDRPTARLLRRVTYRHLLPRAKAAREAGRTSLLPGLPLVYRHVPTPYADLDDPAVWVELFGGRFIAVAQGFRYRACAALARHADRIRRELGFSDATTARADELISQNSDADDFRVGVHIRRGDYATYLGGRFFFGVDHYARLMHKAVRDHPDRRCVFFVCSNERIDPAQFDGLNVCFSNGSPVDDLCLLSRCDLVMGPPSSFSNWAAWVGSTRLLHIENDHALPDTTTADVPAAPISTWGEGADDPASTPSANVA